MTNITLKQQQVIDYISSLIEKNNLTVDSKIDTEINIAKTVNVTRATVREATRRLIDEGLVYRVKGSGLHLGSFNAVSNLTGKLDAVSHFDYQAKKHGYEGKRKIISAGIIKVPNKHIADMLKIKTGDYVYHIIRLLCFNDIPVTLQDTLIPTYLIPKFEFTQLEKSKFDYIEKVTQQKIKKSIQKITAESTQDPNTINLLNVEKNSALLRLEELTLLENGIPCEYNISLMKSEFNTINRIIERKI